MCVCMYVFEAVCIRDVRRIGMYNACLVGVFGYETNKTIRKKRTQAIHFA